MTLPTRWNPFQTARFDPFRDFDDLVRRLGTQDLISREYEKTMEMRMDITEDDGQYRVAIDIPGVRKEDIEVSVDGNQVSVSAKVERESTKEDEKTICSERYQGKAYRSFLLPSEIDAAKAEAHYDGGVLSLALPKKAGNGSRKLSVN
ncbi:Hsp20/alpha crystallin family protein [Marilutibacter chinensis]|uniref:Hsp20/alpha crystallin family protein n=1 Tax=Marilutibacter chinensis TaxID=2912247 RepID=A0ABS9HQF9_9GAMM|nr:Hsp20/alpha crystallin family protein [Lysobacter chinensis]MCF7220352.1 Hsp20/alpha crystallin family protein [Lysobacter chinensis]